MGNCNKHQRSTISSAPVLTSLADMVHPISISPPPPELGANKPLNLRRPSISLRSSQCRPSAPPPGRLYYHHSVSSIQRESKLSYELSPSDLRALKGFNISPENHRPLVNQLHTKFVRMCNFFIHTEEKGRVHPQTLYRYFQAHDNKKLEEDSYRSSLPLPEEQQGNML